jgi:iron complex outermembrane receptor protein
MPSRIDAQLYAPAQPPYLLAGGPDFDSEKVIAYELGYRVAPEKRMSGSLSGFYNDYSDIRSLQQANPPAPAPLVVSNGFEADSYGVEIAADARPLDRLRLHAGYTELRVRFRTKSWSTDTSNGDAESHDPHHQALLRAALDLPGSWELDGALRYVGPIENQSLPGYAELDLRLGWSPTTAWELSLVGQNLLHDEHAEFGAPGTRQEIGRSGYVKAVWRH